MSKLIKKTQTFLYPVLAMVLFGGLTIGIILFAQGKRIDDNGNIVSTSIIRLSGLPKNSEVFVNDEKVSLSGERVEGLKAGELNVKITKPGYIDWAKKTTLEANEVKQLRVKMIPSDLVANAIATNLSVRKIVPSPNRESIVYITFDSEKENLLEFWQYANDSVLLGISNQESNEKIASIKLTGTKTDSAIDDLQIYFSSDSKRLAVISESNKIFSIIDLKTQDNNLVDLYKQFNFVPDNFYWYEGSDTIVVSRQNLVFEFDLTNFIRKIIYFNPEAKPILSVTKNRVYLYDKATSTISVYRDGETTSLELPQKFDLPSEVINLYSTAEHPESFVAKTKTGLYYFNLKEEKQEFIKGEINFMQFGNDGLTFLYSNATDVYLFRPVDASARDLDKGFESVKLMKFNNKVNYYYSANSGLTYFTEDLGNSEYRFGTVDFDGENLTIILPSVKLQHPGIFVDSEDKNFYLVTSDSKVLADLVTSEITQELDADAKVTESLVRFELEIEE